MNNRQNVPGIARGPQNFSQRNLPPISNPMGQPPAMQQQQAADDVSIQDELAMEIYTRLASRYIAGGVSNPHKFQEFANLSRIAAQAFFEENPNNG